MFKVYYTDPADNRCYNWDEDTLTFQKNKCVDRVTAQFRAYVVWVARHFIEVHYKTSTSLRWIWGPARKPLVCFNKVINNDAEC